MQRALAADFSVLSPQYEEWISNEYHAQTRWLGFKMLFRSSDKWLIHPRFAPALALDRINTLINWLSNRPKIHVIHIERISNIEWLKSKYVSRQTGIFAGRSYPAGTKVTVPIAQAIKKVRSKDWVNSRLRSLEDTNPYVRVTYEDFLSSAFDVTRCLVKFLDCDAAKLQKFETPIVKKQSSAEAKDYITNYDQLTEALTQYRISA
jgi:hypothetical protein